MDAPGMTTDTMDSGDVGPKLIQLVCDHKFDETLSELKALPADTIQHISWELLPLVISETDGIQQKNEDIPGGDSFNDTVDAIISTLSASSTPKELLLIYMESLPSIETTYAFDLVLDNISDCLRKRREYSKASFVWALEVISDSLSRLPLPKEANYENAEERKLMDLDPSVHTINDRYGTLLRFLKDQFACLDDRGTKLLNGKDQLQICSHLVRPLGTTFGLLDFCPDEKGKAASTQHVQAVRLVGFIEKVCNPILVMELAECRRAKYSEDEFKVDSLSAGVLAYIVVCLNKSFPRVYSPDTFANLWLTLSWKLLSSQKILHVMKGLDLMEEALVYVDCVNKSDALQLVTLRLLKALFIAMTACSVREARTKALSLWNKLFDKCHSDIQLELLLLLFRDCENPSVRGFIVDLWRKQSLKSNRKNGSEIVRKLIFLPDEEKTDLLHHSEYLLASLNMLRHLFLHRMLEKLPILESYLTSFKRALQLSRAHYELQLRADSVEKKDSLVPNVPKNMEKDVLGQALTRFDLMESLLGMVQSLYDSV